MKKHAVIIRMWHKNEEEMNWRIHYFASVVLPRLQAQSYKNFDICILTHLKYFNTLRELDPRIKPFTLSQRLVGHDGKDWEYRKHGNFSFKDTKGLEKYLIQTRIDSDDLVGPRFIELIEHNIKTESRSIVSWQPQLFILKDLSIKKMNHRYRDDRPSMFLSVSNPDPEDYDFIYSRVFFSFGKYPCRFFEEGQCWMTIHQYNVGSGIHS